MSGDFVSERVAAAFRSTLVLFDVTIGADDDECFTNAGFAGVASPIAGNTFGALLTWGEGRANEAVEERVGVACDDDKIAGTEVDLMRLGFVFCDGTGGFSAAFVDKSVDDLAEMALGVGFGFVSGPLDRLMVAGFLEWADPLDGWTLSLESDAPACGAPDAQSAATAVTLPPRPPRADLTSYLTSGSLATSARNLFANLSGFTGFGGALETGDLGITLATGGVGALTRGDLGGGLATGDLAPLVTAGDLTEAQGFFVTVMSPPGIRAKEGGETFLSVWID